MNDCLSRKEVELLNKRELRGERLYAALKHLETCESCRLKIEIPTRKEVLERIFIDKDEIADILASPLSSSSRNKK